MEQKPKLQPSKIQIIDFNIIHGLIESPFEFDGDQIAGHSFNAHYDMGFDIENKLVKTDFKVDIATESKEETDATAKGAFHFVFIFTVENLDELVHLDAKEGKLEVNADLANALASITYSTSRGVLITRFQGTALRRFMLPVINPNDLLGEEGLSKNAK